MTERRILMIGGLIAVAVLVAGAAFLAFGRQGDDFAQCRSSNVAGGLDAFGTGFTLTNQDNQRVSDQQVFDRPSLLYFGYTFCPDICPMDVARNDAAVEILKEQGLDVQSVLITVDPRRDTPEVLADYTAMYGEGMIALTGGDEEIAAANKGWRNYYKAHDEEDQDYYLVDHMTNTYLVMPGNQTVEYFPNSLSPDDLAGRTACFVRAAS